MVTSINLGIGFTLLMSPEIIYRRHCIHHLQSGKRLPLGSGPIRQHVGSGERWQEQTVGCFTRYGHAVCGAMRFALITPAIMTDACIIVGDFCKWAERNLTC